jgi:hypothetical protein
MVEHTTKTETKEKGGSKPLWRDGQISFDIPEETNGLFAGSTIKGTVMVH